MKMMPAILTNRVEMVQRQIGLVQEYLPEAQVVQIDVVDASFGEELTVTAGDLEGVDFGEISLEFHLMMDEPIDGVNEILEVAGAGLGIGMGVPVRGIIGQIEHMSNVVEFLEEVTQKGWRAGVSLDLYTPLEEIDWEKWSGAGMKMVQLMGVEAGRQGQKMNDLVLEKIIEAKEKIGELGLEVEVWVDGGVKRDNLETLRETGADGVVMGSGLWEELESELE